MKRELCVCVFSVVGQKAREREVPGSVCISVRKTWQQITEWNIWFHKAKDEEEYREQINLTPFRCWELYVHTTSDVDRFLHLWEISASLLDKRKPCWWCHHQNWTAAAYRLLHYSEVDESVLWPKRFVQHDTSLKTMLSIKHRAAFCRNFKGTVMWIANSLMYNGLLVRSTII